MPKITHFHSKHCDPCREMKPEIDKLKKSGVKVKMVDIDSREGSRYAEKLRINAVPTTIIQKGEKKIRFTGVASKEDIEKRL